MSAEAAFLFSVLFVCITAVIIFHMVLRSPAKTTEADNALSLRVTDLEIAFAETQRLSEEVKKFLSEQNLAKSFKR